MSDMIILQLSIFGEKYQEIVINRAAKLLGNMPGYSLRDNV